MCLDINNLPEVISEEDFHNLIEQVIKKKASYKNSDLINYVDILGEKYEKFYDASVLTQEESDGIFEILKHATDFSNISLIEKLVGILFQFRIDKYANYLKSHLSTINSEAVNNEVKDSLREYWED